MPETTQQFRILNCVFGRGPSRYGLLGRIPGSVNVPAATLMNEDGTLLTPAAAAAAFHTGGVEPDSNVIAYCGGGNQVRS